MNCLYCHQAIYETETTPGYQGRPIHMRGKYRHVEGDVRECDPAKIDPFAPRPKCPVCKVEEPPHNGFCSMAGTPPHVARPAPVERPEYVACIEATPTKSLCGRGLITEWAFRSLAHAREATAQGSRLVPCPECLSAAGEATG